MLLFFRLFMANLDDFPFKLYNKLVKSKLEVLLIKSHKIYTIKKYLYYAEFYYSKKPCLSYCLGLNMSSYVVY